MASGLFAQSNESAAHRLAPKTQHLETHHMKTNKTPKAKVNKSAWIRKQAKRLTPVEVVAKAKLEGIKLTPNYVAGVRHTARAKAALQSAGKPAAPKPATKPSKPAAGKGKTKKAATVVLKAAKAVRSPKVMNGISHSIEA